MTNAECSIRNGKPGASRPNPFRSALAIILAVLLPVLAWTAPQMPMGFKVAFSNDTGRTWRQMGTLSQPFAMSLATVKTSMSGQGYTLVHDIAENANATRRLLFWRKDEDDVILMIWQEDLYNTGVSWGISKRGADGDEEAFVVAEDQQSSSAQFAQQVLQDGRRLANKEKDEN